MIPVLFSNFYLFITNNFYYLNIIKLISINSLGSWWGQGWSSVIFIDYEGHWNRKIKTVKIVQLDDGLARPSVLTGNQFSARNQIFSPKMFFLGGGGRLQGGGWEEKFHYSSWQKLVCGQCQTPVKNIWLILNFDRFWGENFWRFVKILSLFARAKCNFDSNGPELQNLVWGRIFASVILTSANWF